jgi:hypothetical protein
MFCFLFLIQLFYRQFLSSPFLGSISRRICKSINFMSVRRAVDVRYAVRHKFLFSTYLQQYRATISRRYKIGWHNDVHVQNWLVGTGERCRQRLFAKVFSSEPRVGRQRQATSGAWAETQNQERPRPSLERIRFTGTKYVHPQCMSPRRNWDCPNPLSCQRVCPSPQEPRGGGGLHTRLRVRGWGSPNSDDWRKSSALCLQCLQATAGRDLKMCQYMGDKLTGNSRTEVVTTPARYKAKWMLW